MSDIRLLIDDSSAPWAETYCTVQSFKRQQGGVDHRPVQYRVATDFPGAVTMTTPAGVVRTLTADYSATLPLDEGGVTIKADGSAVPELESGTYYVWLKQEESSLELIVEVDVRLDPWALIVEYPEALSEPEHVYEELVASDTCSLPITFLGNRSQGSVGGHPLLVGDEINYANYFNVPLSGQLLLSEIAPPRRTDGRYATLVYLQALIGSSPDAVRSFLHISYADSVLPVWRQTGSDSWEILYSLPRRGCPATLPHYLVTTLGNITGTSVFASARADFRGSSRSLLLTTGGPTAATMLDVSDWVAMAAEGEAIEVIVAFANASPGDVVRNSLYVYNVSAAQLPHAGSMNGFTWMYAGKWSVLT